MFKNKLGRRPRGHDSRIPLITAERGIALPSAINYASGMPANLGMMLNDSLGDCVPAGAGHSIQVWSYNATLGAAMVTPSDPQVESFYELAGGYVPGNANTDNGTVIQVALQDWLKTPIDGNQIAGFVEISTANMQAVKETIYECGLVFIGLNVPNFVQSLENPGSVWDVNPSADNTIEGGHCVICTGYQENGNLNFVTWGSADYQMTPAFWNAFVDEAYAIASPDFIKATGSTPVGLTLTQLEALMASMQQPSGPPSQRRRHRHHRRVHRRPAVV